MIWRRVPGASNLACRGISFLLSLFDDSVKSIQNQRPLLRQAGWHNKISEATLADAILDRIVHDSYTLEIQYVDANQDKSMREVYGLDAKKKN